MSCYRDLNPGPLPYQGSALPLSYNSKKKKSGRRGSNPRPSAWKANALSTELLPHSCQSCHSDCGQRWIRTTEVERQQIYSLPHLATLVFALNISNKELKSKANNTLNIDVLFSVLLLILPRHANRIDCRHPFR